MGTFTQSTNLKGIFDFDLEQELATVTKIDAKNGTEEIFDLLEVLDYYNGKNISITIKEDKKLEPVE